MWMKDHKKNEFKYNMFIDTLSCIDTRSWLNFKVQKNVTLTTYTSSVLLCPWPQYFMEHPLAFYNF